jgi:meiotically up-regulated gene 157 (Mug157) protein
MDRRPQVSDRCFYSAIVDDIMNEISSKIGDPELTQLFSNCFPNTLDTTVQYSTDESGRPDTFVITGDIDAMWLRDSTNQVWPYLQIVNSDPNLDLLIQGVVNRQAKCVLLDSYANAFYKTSDQKSDWVSDHTEMKPCVHERKYELDSLCSVIRMSYGYYDATKKTDCFDATWKDAMRAIVATIKHCQAGSDEQASGDYYFQRTSPRPTETLASDGYGQPAKRCGLSKSPFRPSDDAAMLPFLVPANAMAVVSLKNLAKLWEVAGEAKDAAEALALSLEIDRAIRENCIVDHKQFGKIYAYEADGFGSTYLMDDANVPSLLSLPYLGYCASDDPTYLRTREFILSDANPYYSAGSEGRGVGSPHTGLGTIWPIAITIQALTSNSEQEVIDCLNILKRTHAGYWFMHESFRKDNAAQYSRDWFAWANTLFGELILSVRSKFPGLLEKTQPFEQRIPVH